MSDLTQELVIPAGTKRELVIIHSPADRAKDEIGRKDQIIRLAGLGASIEIDEVFLAKDAKSTIVIIHDAPHTYSKVRSRGVVGKNERVTAHATIIIPKESIVCESAVSQRFLLIDESAKVEAIPSLEIEADDVRATHATAITALDVDKLFYLQARGFSFEEARKVMIEGFLALPRGFEHLLGTWQG